MEIVFNKKEKMAIAYDKNIKIGECAYIELENSWNIIHTEVNKLYQGQGIAKKLVECVIENSKKFDKKLVAECSYAKKIILKQ